MGVDPNWGLLGGNNALANFQTGYNMVTNMQNRRDAREDRNALLQLRKDTLANQKRETDAKLAEDKAKADGEKIIKAGRLATAVRTGKLPFEAGFRIAQQMGFDTTNLRNDPAALDEIITMASLYEQGAFDPKSPEGKIAYDEGLRGDAFVKRVAELHTANQNKAIAIQQGGGVAVYNPITNKTEFAIVPNTVGAAAGAPVQGGAPVQVQSVEEARRLAPGTTFRDPNGVVRVVPGGGGGGNVTSNFLEGIQPD